MLSSDAGGDPEPPVRAGHRHRSDVTVRAVTAFPGHAGRVSPLPRWRSVARTGETAHREPLELRRRLRGHRRPRPRPAVPGAGRPSRHVGPVRSARRRPRRRPRRPPGWRTSRRSRATCTTASSTWRRSSPPSRPAWCRSTPTTATARTRSSTSSTTPTPRRSCSTPRSASCSRTSATGCRGSVAGTSSPTTPAPARTGRRPYESVVTSGAQVVETSVGPQRRRPAAALHRRDDRHAQGRHVAPGRPVQRARRSGGNPLLGTPPAESVRRGRRAARARRAGARGDGRRLPADARHRPVLGVHRDDQRRDRGLAGQPTLRRRRAVPHRRDATGRRTSSSSARPSPARCSSTSTPSPAATTSSSVQVISSSGVMWSHDNKARAAAPHARRRCCSTRSARRRPSGWARRSPPPASPSRRRSSRSPRTTPCSPTTAAASSRARARSAWSPSAASSRSATTRTRPSRRRRSAPSKGGAGASPATSPRSTPTARIHLLGRGSVCINTGGEKVFPEEVEEALKTHPAVRDAVVVGVPDERFGETICAVVEPAGDGAGRRRRAARPRRRPAGGLQGAAPRRRRGLDRPGGQRQGRLHAA